MAVTHIKAESFHEQSPDSRNSRCTWQDAEICLFRNSTERPPAGRSRIARFLRTETLHSGIDLIL